MCPQQSGLLGENAAEGKTFFLIYHGNSVMISAGFQSKQNTFSRLRIILAMLEKKTVTLRIFGQEGMGFTFGITISS